MGTNAIFEVVYLDLAGHVRKEVFLESANKQAAISNFADIVSPHLLELWQGPHLVASRRPNGPCVVAEVWSVERLLEKTLAPLLRMTKRTRAVA